MALTVVDNRIILDECDSVTGWTATDGPTLFTASPTPIEDSGCLGMQVSNTVEDAYTSITSDDYSGGGTLSIWVQDRAEFDTTTNVGIGIVVGDGTNRIAYAVGGSDGTAFRHDEGPVKWACFIVDLANKPANFVALAGSEANLNEAAITQVGIYFKTLVKSVGGTDNCFWDIIRFADNGVGIETYGGTVGTPESLSTLAAADRGIGNQQAYGIIRELGAGVYGIQGNINLGDNTTTNDTYIDIDGETLTWADAGLSTNNYYRFSCNGNGTGTTDIDIVGSTLTVPSAASASFDGSDANSAVDSTNSVWNGWDQGITIGGSGRTWTGNSFNNCGMLTTTGADLSDSSWNDTTEAADGSALYWNSTSDIDGNLDGTSFIRGTNATHAIEFSSSMTNTSITLRDAFSSGYNAADSQNDSFFNVLATTGTLTINVVGGTGNFSYKSAGATVSVVVDPVDTVVTVLDSRDTSAIQGARVLVYAADGTGSLPYQDSVTITHSTTTASVSHTAHGMSTGDEILIEGADQEPYNGVYTISNVTTNAYDYTMATNPGTNATGTIIATGVVINGDTDVNGEIKETRTWSLAQPIVGRARKSTTSPFFKTGGIAGTISTTAGLSTSVQLIIDE